MLNFTYEEDVKIKNKHVAGISRTFYLSIETIRRPSGGLPNLVRLSFKPGVLH
jgi:hypothetical protein